MIFVFFPLFSFMFWLLMMYSQWVFLHDDGKSASPEKPGAAYGQASIVDVAAEDSVLRYS